MDAPLALLTIDRHLVLFMVPSILCLYYSRVFFVKRLITPTLPWTCTILRSIDCLLHAPMNYYNTSALIQITSYTT